MSVGICPKPIVPSATRKTPGLPGCQANYAEEWLETISARRQAPASAPTGCRLTLSADRRFPLSHPPAQRTLAGQSGLYHCRHCVLIASGIAPTERLTWFMEVAPVLIALTLDDRHPAQLSADAAAHGADRHPRPGSDPVAAPIPTPTCRSVSGCRICSARVRNPYDKIGHFMQGFSRPWSPGKSCCGRLCARPPDDRLFVRSGCDGDQRLLRTD